jgi:hypothetical protein
MGLFLRLYYEILRKPENFTATACILTGERNTDSHNVIAVFTNMKPFRLP